MHQQDHDQPIEEFFAAWREADTALPTPTMEELSPKPKRNGAWPWAAAATVVLGLAFGTWWYTQGESAEVELAEEEVLDTHGIMAWESPTDPLLEDF